MKPRTLPVLIAAACLPPAAIQAQISVTADVAVKSRYLFAGMVFWEGAIARPMLTLSNTFGNGTVTVNGGGVYMFGDYNQLMELDAWGDYYHQITDHVGVYVGAGYYNFKDYLVQGEYAGTPEIYGGAMVYVPLTPSVYVAHDFDLTKGTHVLFSLSHAIPLAESGISLTLAGNVDYNHEYYREDSGFAYADATATLALPLGPVTVSPFAAAQVGFDDQDHFGDWGVFGASASVTF